MGACKTCGANAGLMANECKDCAGKRRKREIAAEEAEFAAIDAALAQRRADHVEARVRLIEETLKSGRPAFLLDSIYVEIDSVINEEAIADHFSLDDAAEWGYMGWELVGVAPRTVGVALTNTSFGSTMGNTWGAGMGGNVVGVHLLFRYTIDSSNLDLARETMAEHFGNEAQETVA